MKGKGLLPLLLLVALLVSACGAAAPAATPEASMDKDSASVTMGEDTMVDDASMAKDEDMADDDMDKDMDDASMAKDEEMADDDMDKDMNDASMAKDEDMVDDDMDKDMDDASMAKDEEMADDDMDKDMDDASMAKDEEMADDDMDKDMDDASMGKDEEMADEAMMDLPTWFSAQLTDVNSGQALSVADLQGKVVLVETMAIWCSNCLRQQQEVKALHEALGERDDLVTLVLDIDANEAAGDLQAYTAKHGFPWAYAIAPREVAREIGQLYGDQFLNPPSTPMLIVDRHGEVHLLPFGRKTAADLEEALAPFLDGEM